MSKVLNEEPIDSGEGLLHHDEYVDLMPANIELSGMEVSLINAMSREKVLKQHLNGVKRQYDYVLLDCMPLLGILFVSLSPCEIYERKVTIIQIHAAIAA